MKALSAFSPAARTRTLPSFAVDRLGRDQDDLAVFAACEQGIRGLQQVLPDHRSVRGFHPGEPCRPRRRGFRRNASARAAAGRRRSPRRVPRPSDAASARTSSRAFSKRSSAVVMASPASSAIDAVGLLGGIGTPARPAPAARAGWRRAAAGRCAGGGNARTRCAPGPGRRPACQNRVVTTRERRGRTRRYCSSRQHACCENGEPGEGPD